METIFEDTGRLVVVRCWCGIQHAIPQSLDDEQMRAFNDGKEPKGIFCPLGHKYIPAGIPEIDKVRRRLAREESAHDQTRADLRETEARRRAEKAAKTRLKNRVGRGICPCCHRHFANVQKHMETKHPGFTSKDTPA